VDPWLADAALDLIIVECMIKLISQVVGHEPLVYWQTRFAGIESTF
jgi:hypothetical protein